MKKEYIKVDLTVLKTFDGDVMLYSGDVGEAIKGPAHSLED